MKLSKKTKKIFFSAGYIQGGLASLSLVLGYYHSNINMIYIGITFAISEAICLMLSSKS